MLGTIVNALAIIVGGTIGLIFKKGIRENYKETVMNAISLAIVLIGIMSAIKTQDLLLMIFSLVIGSILGELLRIEDNLNNLGKFIESKLSNRENNVAKGFVTASLIFCIGSMAIVGSLESGLTGNHQTLFAKSVLDGVFSILFSSTLGIGVLFSSVAVFIYQGFITIAASFMKVLLVESTIREISAIGGLLIMALGLNTLKITKIKVGNMLPAIFIPLIYHLIKMTFF